MKKAIILMALILALGAGCQKDKTGDSVIPDQVRNDVQKIFSDTYGFDPSMIDVKVTDYQDVYAKGSVTMGLDKDLPNMFLAYKDGDDWKLADAWRGDYTCPAIEGHEFPAEMISDCKKANDEFTVADAHSIQAVFADKYKKSMDQVLVRVNQYDTDHARGTVQFLDENGGGNFLAAKIDGAWDVVFDGNGIFTCEAMKPYDFPADMISDCTK